MNIHFTDKQLFNELKNATIAKVVVGSHLYGTNNENSDTDVLHIYATSQQELNTVFTTNHQLQYKENNTDYLFVSLHSFIKNILNGDSTINFEVIQSGQLQNTQLQWLNDFKNDFITYTIIKSYIGLVKRDLKFFYKAKTQYQKNKQQEHIIRGLLYVNNMLYSNWSFSASNDMLKHKLKHNEFSIEYCKNHCDELRIILNDKLNNGTLQYAQKFDVDRGIQFNKQLNEFCNSEYFKNKQANFDINMFINSYENWVNY